MRKSEKIHRWDDILSMECQEEKTKYIMNSQSHTVVKEHEIFREQCKILCGSSTGRTNWRWWSFSGYCSQLTKALCDRLRNLGIREPNISDNQENPRFWIDVNIQISFFFTNIIIILCIMQFFKSPLSIQ